VFKLKRSDFFLGGGDFVLKILNLGCGLTGKGIKRMDMRTVCDKRAEYTVMNENVTAKRTG